MSSLDIDALEHKSEGFERGFSIYIQLNPYERIHTIAIYRGRYRPF
jgi:hypothetical protein